MSIYRPNTLSTKGIHLPDDAFVVLVNTGWNAPIIDKLTASCSEYLASKNIRFLILTVPGAIEIPFAIRQHHLAHPQTSAYIALGCVIKGDTPHFEYVCTSVTQGITTLNITMDAPVVFGVLTVNTLEQALERTGGLHGDKGKEAAETAIHMMLLKQALKT
ncbi:MAG: 6,7-dimethyl-8-ribityllumazine synthase [Ferruginibacter sp.]